MMTVHSNESRAVRRVDEWLRLSSVRCVRRWTAALLCAWVLGVMWWDSRSESYGGLPANTLGQVLGDLITMGIALPFVLSRQHREARTESGFSVDDWCRHSARAVELDHVRHPPAVAMVRCDDHLWITSAADDDLDFELALVADDGRICLQMHACTCNGRAVARYFARLQTREDGN
jgi:hypothetical protein